MEGAALDGYYGSMWVGLPYIEAILNKIDQAENN